MVAARMAAGAVRWARFRGADYSGRRSLCPGGTAAAVLLDPGAVPRTQRHHRLGHAGDQRIPERHPTGIRAASGRSGDTYALPLGLRRDALRFHRAPLVAADEPESALPRVQNLVAGTGRYRPYRDDLEPMPVGAWWS